MTDEGACPREKQIRNQRKKLRPKWKTPEWKTAVAEAKIREPICRFHFDALRAVIKGRIGFVPDSIHLGIRPAEFKVILLRNGLEDLIPLLILTQTLHHPRRESYKDGGYLAPEVLAMCIPSCSTCNFKIERGMILCPRCGKHYYRPVDQTECGACFTKLHPEIVKARERKKAENRELLNRLNRESREKFKTNRAKGIIKAHLYACNRPQRTINQEAAQVFSSIKNSGKNPLTVKPPTLERMTEEWVRKWRT